MIALLGSSPAIGRSDPADAPTAPATGLFGFMNRLPQLIDDNLPFLAPPGARWFYVRPHVGSPFGGKYLRLDTGLWFKVTAAIEINGGVQSYLWRDANDGNALRRGFYSTNFGVKYDRALPGPPGTAMSAGINLVNPISRPPRTLIDGYRHTNPYLTGTRLLSVPLRLVGYGTVGADLLAHTPLPGDFGFNQLHGNSLTASIGVTREWARYCTAILTLSGATTVGFGRQLQLIGRVTPQVVIPVEDWFAFLRQRLPRWHFNLILSARAVRGPDGRELGTGTSMRVDFSSRASPGRP